MCTGLILVNVAWSFWVQNNEISMTCISFTKKYFVNIINFPHVRKLQMDRVLAVELQKDGLQIPVKISLGK